MSLLYFLNIIGLLYIYFATSGSTVQCVQCTFGEVDRPVMATKSTVPRSVWYVIQLTGSQTTSLFGSQIKTAKRDRVIRSKSEMNDLEQSALEFVDEHP